MGGTHRAWVCFINYVAPSSFDVGVPLTNAAVPPTMAGACLRDCVCRGHPLHDGGLPASPPRCLPGGQCAGHPLEHRHGGGRQQVCLCASQGKFLSGKFGDAQCGGRPALLLFARTTELLSLLDLYEGNTFVQICWRQFVASLNSH